MPFEIAPATLADFDEMQGRLPYRARAYTARMGDKIVGLGGFFREEYGRVVAFARLTEDVRRCRIQLHKAARKALDEARKRGDVPVYARADPSVEAAERWLKRLGFVPLTRNEQGQMIFAWFGADAAAQ